METNYNKKENKVIKYVRTREYYKREKNVMRHYLSNYPQNSTHNCLEKRKRWFQAVEIRLRMVKEETSEQMDIFIQHKAVFISIYLEMQLFLVLILSSFIKQHLPARYQLCTACSVSALGEFITQGRQKREVAIGHHARHTLKEVCSSAVSRGS